ncbi:MAG: hypothetical protein ACK6D7_25930, partial [Acidobacteriota bacterium]
VPATEAQDAHQTRRATRFRPRSTGKSSVRPAPSKSAVYRLVSGELTTSKTPIATWHGTASVGSSPPPQAHKSFPGYARGRSHPRGAAARQKASLGADIAESAFDPDAAKAGLQDSAMTYPGATTSPGFDIDYTLSAVHRRFASARLSGPYLIGSGPIVSATLTTIALNDSNSRWFEA